MAGVTRKATIRIDADVRKGLAGMQKVSLAVRNTEEDTARLRATLQKLEGQIEAGAKGYSSLGIGVDKLKAGIAGLAGPAKVAGLAIAGIGLAVGKVVDLADESLKAQAAVNNLKWSVEGAAEASLGLVTNAELATAQVNALQLGAVSSLEEFEQLAEAGSILGLVMAGDAAHGVESLTTAISRNSPLLLDNLGIQLTQTQAQQEYAAQLGKTAAELSDAEKAQAFKTIALQKATAAAREKNIEDNAALWIKQQEVAWLNEKAELLGAEEAATLRLSTAIESMGDEIIGMNVTKHGADLRRVEKAMRKYGVSVEDAGGLAEVQAKILRAQNILLEEQAAAAHAAAEAEERRIRLQQEQQMLAAAQADQANLQHGIAMAVAEFGASSEEAAYQALSLAAANLEVARTAAEASTATDAERKALIQAQRQFELSEARIRGLGNRRSRGGGGRKREDPAAIAAKERAKLFAAEVKIKQRLIEVEKLRGAQTDELVEGLFRMQIAEAKAIGDKEALLDAEHDLATFQIKRAKEESDLQLQLMEDLGEIRQAQREREKEREDKAFDLRMGRLERELEWREANGMDTESQKRNIAELTELRLRSEGDVNAAEAAAHAERIRRFEEEQKHRAKIAKQFEDVANITVGGFAAAGEAALTASENSKKAFRTELAAYAGGKAKMLAIESVTQTALGAIWAAALNPVKAAAHFTAAGIAAAKGAALGGIAAGLGGAEAFGVPGADGGGVAGSGSRTPSTAGMNQRPGASHGAPVSPLEQNGQPVPAANDAGGKVVNIHVAGSVIDGAQLQELINESNTVSGKLRGGMG